MAAATGGQTPASRPSARQRLLTAARVVLARDGVEGLTLRAIAREAGVSHGAPLRHFPTLGRLLAALGAEGFDQLRASVAAAVGEPAVPSDDEPDDRHRSSAGRGRPSTSGRPRGDDGHGDDGHGDDPLQRVARAGRGYLRFATAEPGVFSVMFRPDLCDVSDPGYQDAGAAAFDQLVEVVEAAQATGWQSELPAIRLAAVLWANVHGLAELWLHGALQTVVDVDHLEALADDLFALSGLHDRSRGAGNRPAAGTASSPRRPRHG